MNPDLQRAMEQRRRKSESKGEDASGLLSEPAFSPTKKALSKVSMGQDLQAIMARRRKMAGDASEDEDVSPLELRPIPGTQNDPPENAEMSAKLSTHFDQKGNSGRRRRTTDGESTASGSVISKSGERRSRRKPRNNGDESDEPLERRKSRSRRGKSGDADELSVDQSVSSRRRRSSDDDTTSSGRKSRPSDDRKRPPTSAGSSIPDSGTSSSDAGGASLPFEFNEEGDKKLRRKKISTRSLSSGEDEPVSKIKNTRPKPSAGLDNVDVQHKGNDLPAGGSDIAVKLLDPMKKATSSGWGDFPAFGGTEGIVFGNNNNGGDVFDSFPVDTVFSSSGNNADTDFGAFDSSIPTNRALSPKLDLNKSLSKKDFDVAFSASVFDNEPTFEAFDSKSTPVFDSGFSALPMVEEAAPQKVWDKSPLAGDLPSRFLQRPKLSQEVMMRAACRVHPVSNPSNGNIICCNEKDGMLRLVEIDPNRGNLQISCTVIMSHEFRQKVLSKYNVLVHKVQNIGALSAGLHHTNAKTLTLVAAILDLLVLESGQVLRVVAVWQWGYGTTSPVALQYTISPPSGGDFSFEPSTLRNADSLLFIAGASPKGPCIFICKPSVKETWSANFLGGSGNVSCITVSSSLHRMHHYLVVAIDDGSINVWTYKAVILPLSSKESLASKRWLSPVCRLEHSSAFSSTDSTPLQKKSSSLVTGSGDVGCCTQLEWLSPAPSLSPLLMLAAAFQNGLAVFHVGLPVIEDSSTKLGFKDLPETSTGSALTQVPSIGPIVARKWEARHKQSSIVCLSTGPHHGLCLALLLHEEGENSLVRVIIGIIDFPLYKHGPLTNLTKDRLVPFRILTSLEIDGELDEKPIGFLSSPGLSDLFAFSKHDLLRFAMRDPSVPRTKAESMVSALGCPVISNPSGLSTLGEVLFSDSASDGDESLYIFSSLQCERKKAIGENHLFEWSRPMIRHWLCRTVVGDKKKHQNTEKDTTPGEVHGGAESNAICELFCDELDGYVPIRILNFRGSSLCAIAYKRALGNSGEGMVDVSCAASLLAFVDWSSGSANTSIEVLQARDVAFLPSTYIVRGVVLSLNGSTLTYFEWDEHAKRCNLKSGYRPVVGVDTNMTDFLDCRRIFAFEGAGKVVLAAAATRIRDDRSCVVIGELVDSETIIEDNWSALLPNIEADCSCFLEKHEEVISMIGLECDDSGYRNFAVSTSDRMLILTSGLTMAAKTNVDGPCLGFSPLGAFVVGYVVGCKVCYLCCLDDHLASGSLCSFPLSKCQYSLISIRADRVVAFEVQSGGHTVELGQSGNVLKLQVAKTFPALLLEPMIANVVCVGGKENVSTPMLRTVIEKFGRKLASITHGEKEGIGTFGAGLTARVFEILGRYGLTHASTWLLTGAVQFERTSNSRISSPWLSVAQKMKGGFSSDILFHLVSSGDQYFSDYLKSPDHSMASSLPRQSDPSVYLCRAYAETAMLKGHVVDALKTNDMAGTQSTENSLVQLALLRERQNTNIHSELLKVLKGHGDKPSSTPLHASTAYSAVAVFLSEQRTHATQMHTEMGTVLTKPLALSLQRGMRVGRPRQKLIGETALAEFGLQQSQNPDSLWVLPCNEAKHIWNEGPGKQKENLLMLDRMEDWMGRRRPLILGKEGASAARDRGEKTLADILNQEDNDSFGGKSDTESEDDGWVEGVGEGRSDEANLCVYFRMSEGDDEDNQWKTDGLQDLSPYQNKLSLVGDTSGFSLQESTSSVDEGETGKVKSLYDIVFDCSGVGKASGLALSATRGCSIDLGVLHSPDRRARKKCTIEFWYYVPSALSSSMVLARRTIGPDADDFTKVCLESHKDSVLWELILLKSGELEFHSCGGTVLLSSANYKPPDQADDTEDARHDRAMWGRWNHACIVMSSRGLSASECSVSLFMKGIEVTAGDVSMIPQAYEESDMESFETLNEIMQKSHVVFGLNHVSGFRMTDFRIWACERTADDTQSFMYEYLTAAESKKKFKVKISSKNKGVGVGKGAKGGELRQSLFATTKSAGKSTTGLSKGLSLAPPPKGTLSLVPTPKSPRIEKYTEEEIHLKSSFEVSFDAFDQSDIVQSPSGSAVKRQNTDDTNLSESAHDDSEAPATLWDTALPLSKQIRSSAAAALIRGPPATRHFGGNRGGLPDFSGMERFGVGGIAICGSEKTIVWRDNEDPPALTYPLGASGAVVSDQMDDMGSEFLCCFLARERKMIVFELQSKTVVVELQMTTKLNFWRYLPPEAAENTLCFMLVTPVGGFHWMPLEESPRPHQVWKRGPDLQGKKVVSYEEGGSNGLDESDICSKLGLVMVTKETGGGFLESWIIPINGDSRAVQVSDDVLGACFCQPPIIEDGAFLPLLVTVHNLDEGVYVNILSIKESAKGSVELGEIEASHLIEMGEFEEVDLKPPSLAMGTFPEALCCSLSNIIVVIIRRKGLIAAFELEGDDLSLIAQETVGHYIVDAVMRYSAEVGGAEIVMMLSDIENPKDGWIVSFCFRSAV